ncbi:hypothetical protein CRH09_32240 [Nocardia terpenica]|uniref:Uncharacterized protein n=2 Tax=Nocardia terpenica TaxID=455432 RepID=A0A291RXL3_9NOCA|nr:hypothetical protein CRH09_32240 [Nocardia terpenica]
MGADSGPPPNRTQPFPNPTRTSRILLRAQHSTHPGDPDGAWWPWTPNLTAELHDLISALTPRLGHITRIGFDWNAASLAQRRGDHDDGVHMHGPDVDQPPDIMRMTGTQGTALTLLIVPFDTSPDQADNRMRQAAGHPPPP